MAAVPALLTTMLLIAGCSGSGGSSAGDAAAPAKAEPGNALRDEPASASKRTFSATGEAAELDAATNEGAFDSGGTASAPRNRAAPEYQERAIISTGTVSLRSDDVGKARFDLEKVLDEHRGEISDEQTATDTKGRTSRSRLVVRVPAEDFDAVMEELSRIPGTDLASAKRSSEDVTTQVIDTAVRVRAQKASIERIEGLLARAKTIRSIVWIESQLTRRQTELDSLEQQQAYLEDQASMSTINVFLERTEQQAATGEKKTEEGGFVGGLHSGLDALASAGTATATVIGALLPFGVLLGLVGIPAWWLLRRRVRTDRDPLPAP